MNLINMQKTTFYKWIFIVLTMLLLVSCDNSVNSCSDKCNFEGEFTCNGDEVLLCEQNANGCLETKKIKNCVDEDKTCFNGSCEQSCDKDCGGNSSCILMNEVQTCECNANFHHPEDGDETCIDSKQVFCDPQNPDNSTVTDLTVLVEVKWNDEKNRWNDPTKCAWTCNKDYHIVLDTSCEPDTLKVPCKDITPPSNATQKTEDVDIVWNSVTKEYSQPANCEWECNPNYHQDGETCVENACDSDSDCQENAHAECNPNPTCVNHLCENDYKNGENCTQDNKCIVSPTCNDGICTGIQNTCSNNSTCDQSNGECSCDDGYTLVNGVCEFICSDTNSHTNTTNNGCTCNNDYTLVNEVCIDRNECTDESHNCNENATCTNSIGSFNCSCNSGYSGGKQITKEYLMIIK